VPDPVRRDFDVGLELVTPPVPTDTYRVVPGVYRANGGPERQYDAYLPQPPPAHPPPTVILVHGDGPPEFLDQARLWGQYRSWGALLAANGLAAIAFDHGSSHGRTRIPSVVAEIQALLDAVDRDGPRLGIDATRKAVWSGSAGVPLGIVASLDQPGVRCQIAFYGPMYLRTDATRTEDSAPAADLEAYSPITHLERLGASFPPTFIAKAGLDRPGINDSIEAFVAQAEQLSVPVTLLTHPDGRHAFDVLDDDDRSREIIEAAVDFMLRWLT